VALLVPDYVRETFVAKTEHGGHDGDDGRSLRYLEWTIDPDLDDTTYRADYVIVMRDRGGDTRVVEDCHIEGLFPRAEWMRILREAGFEPSITRDEWGRDLFVAKRPA
jgi:hypothetical protein